MQMVSEKDPHCPVFLKGEIKTMGNLLSYSGINTKIRAMKSRLITEEQLSEIVRLHNIAEVVAYLRRTPRFEKEWTSLSDSELHRENLEKYLRKSIFTDFCKLYQFADSEQRKFLDLYAGRYEIRILKEIITNLFDFQNKEILDYSLYSEFFRKHSCLDLPKLCACQDADELVEALRGTEYYKPLKIIQGIDPLIFDDGMALDLYYFTHIWKVRNKLFSGKDLEFITNTYGEKFDMLNLQFIYRSRRYYRMAPADIYSLLIPVYYHLSRKDIQIMTESEDPASARAHFLTTWYGKKYRTLYKRSHVSSDADSEDLPVDPDESLNLEFFYSVTLMELLQKSARENPYSAAVLFNYLYLKENETSRLITAMESVRYGMDPAAAMSVIHNT